MKQLLLLLGLSTQLTAFANNLPLLDTAPARGKILKAALITTDKRTINSYLINLTDSTVLTTFSPIKFNTQVPDNSINHFSYNDIKTIKIRRKGAVGRGILWGAISGAVLGAVAGLISGDDKIMAYPDPSTDYYGFGGLGVALNNAFAMTAGEKALAYGATGAFTGALIGAIIGAVSKKKFIIHGKRENLNAMRASVLEKMKMTISN